MKHYYKLTTQENTTYNNFKWRKNKWYKTSGDGALCEKGWFHFYHDKDLAVLLNPIHANIKNPKLWKAECRGKSLDDNGLKIGCSEARLVEEIPIPKWSTNQKIAFGILCAKEVYDDEEWNKWANNWLDGSDRSEKAAESAAEAAAAKLDGELNFKSIISKAKKIK